MNIKLKSSLKQAINECGFDQPTPVQEHVIPIFLQGKNLFVQAKTGAGKTASYLIPIIEKIEPLDNNTRAIIITPTRELAQQVARSATKLAVYAKVKIVTLIGDTPIQTQYNALKTHPNILIATPGRFLDLYRQGYLEFKHLQTLVLDEADQLLANGQESEVSEIISILPSVQTCLFSATLDERMYHFFHTQFELLQIDDPTKLNEKISTFYIETENKETVFLKLIKQLDISQAIVFMDFIQDTLKYADLLQKQNVLAHAFSSYYDQRKRNQILENFRQGKIRVLVASDAAARGLDFPNISHIIHFDLPINFETYLHRSGRSAHRNNQGISITLLNQKEKHSKIAQMIIESSNPYIFNQNQKNNHLNQTIQNKKEKYPNTQTFIIRAGKKNKIRTKDIVGALCAITKFEEIGTIEIQDDFSTVILLKPHTMPQKLMIKGKMRAIEKKIKID